MRESHSGELADFDESSLEIESWDKTEQYAKYMEKNAANAEQKF